MKKAIIVMIFLFCLGVCMAYEGIGVTLIIDQQDNVEIFSISESTLEDSYSRGYEYVFLNSAGQEIKRGRSEVDFWVDFTEANTTYFSVQVTGSDVGELIIYNLDNEQIFRENISEFICNYDGDCDEFEDYNFCPSDCSADGEDDYCNDELNGFCDPDCGQRDIDCTCGDGECNQNERYFKGSCPEDCDELAVLQKPQNHSGDEAIAIQPPDSPDKQTDLTLILVVAGLLVFLIGAGIAYFIIKHRK